MAYGGLRGAVGFSLVEMISKDIVPPKQMFVTTMLATVVFTVFFQVKTMPILSFNYKIVATLSRVTRSVPVTWLCFGNISIHVWVNLKQKGYFTWPLWQWVQMPTPISFLCAL